MGDILKPVLKPGGLYSRATYSFHLKEEFAMNKKLADLIVLGSHVNRQHVRLLIALVSLGMLVVGIGAPVRGGGV
jgi:hypothetical protein